MKLLIENWRQFLNESAEEHIESSMEQAFNKMLNSLDKIEPKQQKEVDEALGLAVAGGVLAIPQVMEIIGETINFIVPKLTRALKGVDREDSTALGNLLIKKSHALHDKYVKPIAFVIKKIFPNKDGQWVKKTTNRIFHLIVAAFLIAAGAGALSAFRAALAGKATLGKITLGTVEAGMSAVKGDEIREFIFEEDAH
jgi:hypothetical protein|tara:strand:- start:487 stop:1077 length:591 start_codon:yes stop_codon:yes gene_type:complete